jgi:uncharacterized membrane protein YdjX (TVP38/TMEM64 family)
MDRKPSRRSLGGLAGGLVVCALVVALFWLGWDWLQANHVDIRALTPEDAEAFVRAWGAWGPLGSLVLMVLHSFLPLPAEIIAIGNGMLFGPWLGILLTWSGAMLGALLSFALARWLGRPCLRLFVSEDRLQGIDATARRPGTLLMVRLVPVISFNLVNYAAGMLGVGWWTFLWTTALGILPLTVAMVLLGDQLMAAPWWAWMLVAIAVLGSALALRQLDRHRRRTTL